MTRIPLNMAAHPETFAELDAKLTNPAYERRVVPGTAICAWWKFSPQQLSNWVRRSDRTGVHRYRGGYDPNEVLRWIAKRGETRRGGTRHAS